MNIEQRQPGADLLRARIRAAEDELRYLIDGRGMRPGRAIRRALGTTDAQTQAIAGLWSAADHEFSVIIGDTTEPGADCLAAVCRYGDYTACCAVRGDWVERGQGDDWRALEALVVAVGGAGLGSGAGGGR